MISYICNHVTSGLWNKPGSQIDAIQATACIMIVHIMFPYLMPSLLPPSTLPDDPRNKYNEWLMCVKKNEGDETKCYLPRLHAKSMCPGDWVGPLSAGTCLNRFSRSKSCFITIVAHSCPSHVCLRVRDVCCSKRSGTRTARRAPSRAWAMARRRSTKPSRNCFATPTYQ